MGEEASPACAICLLAFEEGEQTTRLPCFHMYHTECIDAHAITHGMCVMDMRCPQCRKTPTEVDAAARALLEAAPAPAPVMPGIPEIIDVSEPSSPAGDGAGQSFAGVDGVIDAVPPASPVGVIDVADIATDVPATQQDQQDRDDSVPQQDAIALGGAAPQQDAQILSPERAMSDDDMPLEQVRARANAPGSLLGMMIARARSQPAKAPQRRRAKSSPPVAKANVACPPPPPPKPAATVPADAGAQAKGKRAPPAKKANVAKAIAKAAKAAVGPPPSLVEAANVASKAAVGPPPSLAKAAVGPPPSLVEANVAGPPPPPPKLAATVPGAQAKGKRAAGPANGAPPAKKANVAQAKAPVINVDEVPLRPDRSEAPGSSNDHLVLADGAAASTDNVHDNNLQLALVDPELCQCGLCGSIVQMAKVRILSKKQGTYTCAKCASTVTKLYRETGGVPKLTGMTPIQINEFYTRAQTCFTALELHNLKKEFNVTKEAQQAIYYDNQGKYLPLSVWGKMGYDVDAIKNLSSPQDVRSDPVLGDVYRVVTMMTGQRGHEGTIVSECLGVKGSGKGQTNPEQILALTGELKKAKNMQKDAEASKKKKANLLKTCATNEMKIRNILAMNPGAFSESVLQSVESLLASVPALVDSDVKDAVCDYLMEAPIMHRAFHACNVPPIICNMLCILRVTAGSCGPGSLAFAWVAAAMEL